MSASRCCSKKLTNIHTQSTWKACPTRESHFPRAFNTFLYPVRVTSWCILKFLPPVCIYKLDTSARESTHLLARIPLPAPPAPWCVSHSFSSGNVPPPRRRNDTYLREHAEGKRRGHELRHGHLVSGFGFRVEG